jgi:hypothetical protein
MWPAFPASEYYGGSATPWWQQWTMHLPRTSRPVGHHQDASPVHQSSVGRVGVQLDPCGIAVQYRTTLHSLARPMG